jgi:DNA-binding response OmpR family regulator
MARILVIDDEANIRMMLRMALEKNSHTVGQAADGPEGLEKYGDGIAWDLVLLDQRMPGIEGLKVLDEIRRRRPKARVIMITAFVTVDLVTEAMTLGAEDFLRKPFTLETLRDSVNAALLEDLWTNDTPLGSPSPGMPFALKTFNGFRMEALRHPVQRRHGDIRQMLTVRSPDGNLRPCEVVLQPEFIRFVQEDTGLHRPADDEAFWQGLCEEALANYLWQNSQIPFGGVLKVDEYTTNLRRWVLATAAHRNGAPESLLFP